MHTFLTNITSSWSVYDALIEGVSASETLTDFAAGLHWFAALRSNALGLAMSPAEGRTSVSLAGHVMGRSIRDVAAFSKSWNWADASMGVSAINSWYNDPERVKDWVAEYGLELTESSAFTYLLPSMRGKRVTVVGHFGGLERIAEECELTILERNPQGGDLPDPACEFVLPESDFVILTSTTVLNKTLPRLLELSRNAHVTLAGPTTTFWPGWFNQGVDLISGVVVEEPMRVLQLAREGGSTTFFVRGARMINIANPLTVLT
jgi:uncharacterized protein